MVRFYAGYDGVIIRVEMQLRVQDALNTMGPIDREVLALRHFEELTNKAFAMTFDFDRVKEIFQTAVEQYLPEEREAYLDRACGHDSQLRAQVSLLLAAHATAASAHGPETSGQPASPPTHAPTGADEARSGSAGEVVDADLETAPASASDDVTVDVSATPRPAPLPPIVEGPGSQIGPYRLLQQIGEGGMGAVFMAEQERPVRRRVALKVIKPGMDSAQVLARFEAERQALALMEHPSIARVLDAGATDSGRPFFVMELVNGIPITEYCDQARLSPRERLELFVAVCRAIQHAHQKGIIHRDIKPSNVLVTLIDGKPVPKVIDFGIAKATDQRLTERTLFTQFGSIVGTLEYMSPEQASLSGLDVDTRSDIYSLGVMLYELLAGSTPLERHRLREAGYAEVLRRIKEEEPPRPSTRLSGSGDGLASIAALRNTEPASLTRLVRGELDWIVMRALEKDRNRRYEAATGLARDVERYLADEPVEACPPSAGYRLRKFAAAASRGSRHGRHDRRRAGRRHVRRAPGRRSAPRGPSAGPSRPPRSSRRPTPSSSTTSSATPGSSPSSTPESTPIPTSRCVPWWTGRPARSNGGSPPAR